MLLTSSIQQSGLIMLVGVDAQYQHFSSKSTGKWTDGFDGIVVVFVVVDAVVVAVDVDVDVAVTTYPLLAAYSSVPPEFICVLWIE